MFTRLMVWLVVEPLTAGWAYLMTLWLWPVPRQEWCFWLPVLLSVLLLHVNLSWEYGWLTQTNLGGKPVLFRDAVGLWLRSLYRFVLEAVGVLAGYGLFCVLAGPAFPGTELDYRYCGSAAALLGRHVASQVYRLVHVLMYADRRNPATEARVFWLRGVRSLLVCPLVMVWAYGLSGEILTRWQVPWLVKNLEAWGVGLVYFVSRLLVVLVAWGVAYWAFTSLVELFYPVQDSDGAWH